MSGRKQQGNRRTPRKRDDTDPDPKYTWACSWSTVQSNKDGFFKAIFEGFEDSLNKAQLSTFANLESDARRVAFLLRLEQIDNLNPVPMFRQKNAKEAVDLMVQAETMMQKDNAAGALNILSRAVTKAPGKEGQASGELVCRLLTLRSKALEALEQHELALKDTQLALCVGVPDPLARAQLLRTQGHAYFLLGDQIRAKLAYISAQRLLDPKNNAQFKLELDEEIAKCANASKTDTKKDDMDQNPSPKLTGGENKNIPNTSLLLGVQEGAQTGRFIVARSKIDAGDLLAVEPAYCCVLLLDKAGTHCHNCLARLVAPVGCPECSGVAFCSRECQKTACDTYHRIECHFLNLFIGLGMSVLAQLALRLVTRTGSARKFLHLWDSVQRPAAGVEEQSVSDYRRLLRLVHHPEKRGTRDYLSRTLMAIFLLRCLEKGGRFWPADEQISAEDEQKVAEALLRHICLLQFNAHEVFETLALDRTRVKGTKTNYIGVGVYLSIALFNHDCNAAVARTFSGTKMMLHALRPLHPGEMVGENYGPMFSNKTRAERQRSLRARYWFDCACQACSENWNTFEQGIKSPDKSQALQKMFDMGFEAMEAGKLEGAVYLLSQFINSIDGTVTMPDREICLSIDALRLCLMNLWGNVVVIQPPKIEEKSKPTAKESTVQITELLSLESA